MVILFEYLYCIDWQWSMVMRPFPSETCNPRNPASETLKTISRLQFTTTLKLAQISTEKFNRFYTFNAPNLKQDQMFTEIELLITLIRINIDKSSGI